MSLPPPKKLVTIPITEATTAATRLWNHAQGLIDSDQFCVVIISDPKTDTIEYRCNAASLDGLIAGLRELADKLETQGITRRPDIKIVPSSNGERH